MKKYNVLVLTDHLTHSDQNSVYALAATLAAHHRVEKIQIASRSLAINQPFFKGQERSVCNASSIDKDFAFVNREKYFANINQLDPKEIDIVLMRLPRPISDESLLHIAGRFNHCSIINNPIGIINTSSKSFLLNFPDLTPSIDLHYDIDSILNKSLEMPLVLKPLKEYGGKGILKLENGMIDNGAYQVNASKFLNEKKEWVEKEGYLSMKFMKNVKNGDKRLLVVNGEILAASLRLPPSGSWLCNVAQGGKSIPANYSEEEIAIVNKITPQLTKEGILLYGLDTLEDDEGLRILSEINTLSVGGFPQAEQQTGKPILRLTIEKIITHADTLLN